MQLSDEELIKFKEHRDRLITVNTVAKLLKERRFLSVEIASNTLDNIQMLHAIQEVLRIDDALKL